MKRHLMLVCVMAVVMLLVSGCGADSPEEHGEKFRRRLEERQRANGFSGDIDSAVRRRVDVYRSANEAERDRMTKEVED